MPEQEATITEEMIVQRVGSQSLSRGRGYWQSGAVTHTRREGSQLKARCQGSADNPYRVEAALTPGGIGAAHCSCPVGGSGYCKHVAALLLAWRAAPGSFVEVEGLDAALGRRSKEELIALIRQMLRMEPNLESLLEMPLPVAGASGAIDPAAFRTLTRAAFRHQGSEWDVLPIAAEQLRAVYALGDDFLAQGNPINATAVYRAVLEGVLEALEQFDDQEGELACVVGEVIERLGGALAEIDEQDEAREPALRLLLQAYRFDLRRGGAGLAEQAPDILREQTTPEERATIAGWVREAIASRPSDWERKALGALLLDLEEELLSDEDFLAICRETGRTQDLVDRLLHLGRVDEAITAMEPASDYALLQMEPVFTEYARDELFENLVRQRAQTSADSRLKDWLKKRSLARGDDRTALTLAEELFRARPALPGYQEIREIATRLGEWPTLRSQLLTLIKGKSRDLLIHVYLDEGEVDQALAALRAPQSAGTPGFWYGGVVELAVAQAAEATHPEDAVQIYQKHAERLINNRGRDNYVASIGYLRKARDLHIRLREHPRWERYLANLRVRHRSLRALKEELDRAGL